MASGVLEHLSARLGGLYGLPELHILIQDTINGTLKSLRGTVEAQVNRTLEVGQSGLVRDLVMRLLTQEVVQVTELSAQALMRREMATVELSQKRLFESLAAAERCCDERLAEASKAQTQLAGRLEQRAAEHELLRGRVDALGQGLAKLEGIVQDLAEVSGRVPGLQAECDAAGRRSQDIHEQISQLERHCGEHLATKLELWRVEAELKAVHLCQEERGEAWLAGALRPYVSGDQLARCLDELEARLCEGARQGREAASADLDEVRRAASATCRDLDEARAAHSELSVLCEADRSARAELQRLLREEVAGLRRECAVRASVDRSLEAQDGELRELAGALEQARAQACADRAEFDAALGAVWARLEKSGEALKVTAVEMEQVRRQVSGLDEDQAKMRQGFDDMRLRSQAIQHQQSDSRQELRYLAHRVGGLDALGQATGELRDRAAGHEASLSALGTEVTQWRDAIAAQEGLRRDTTQLRAEVEALRSAFARAEEQQAAGVAQLRELHSRWLLPQDQQTRR